MDNAKRHTPIERNSSLYRKYMGKIIIIIIKIEKSKDKKEDEGRKKIDTHIYINIEDEGGGGGGGYLLFLVRPGRYLQVHLLPINPVVERWPVCYLPGAVRGSSRPPESSV